MIVLNKLKRLCGTLAKRNHPGFIFTLRYFQYKPAPIIAMHRRLFFLSLKTPRDFILNIIGGLRWISYHVWKKNYKCYRFKALRSFLASHPNRIKVILDILQLSVCNFIPPRCYVKCQLYKKSKNEHAFYYFYSFQSSYFHDYTNRHMPRYQQSRALIADKYQFETALQKIGISTIKSELFSTTRSQNHYHALLQKRRFFCKPNNASASKDAFLLDYDPKLDCYFIDILNEGLLTSPSQIHAYLRQVCRRHRFLLIQPLVENIPELQQWSSRDVLTTIRIITGKNSVSSEEIPTLLYVQMEHPLQIKEAIEHNFNEPFAAIPLNIITLDVDPVFKQRKHDSYYENIRLSEQLKRLIQQGIVYCQQAHKQLLNLRSVAFEITLALSDPMILEANYNWDIEMLYNVIDANSLDRDNTHPAALWLKTLIEEIA